MCRYLVLLFNAKQRFLIFVFLRRRHRCPHTPVNEGPIISYQDETTTKTSLTKEEFQAFSAEQISRPVLQRLHTELELPKDEPIQSHTDYSVQFQHKYAERQEA